MIWDREEYISHMTFRGSRREMFCELFGPLKMLEDEWRSQGAAEDEISLERFGWDSVRYAWVPFDVSPVTGIEPRIISESDTETVSIDRMGRSMRLSRKCATIPLPFSWPVRTPEDWDRVRKWYEFREERIDVSALKQMKQMRKEGSLVLLSMPGGFDEPRGLMGEEALCYALYDEPEMVADMLRTFGELMKRGLERILEVTGIDVLSVHEDMAGISGPMIGPNAVRQFISPYYKSVWDLAREGGAVIFSQDSDGNIEPVLDELVEAGINCIYPVEPKAGMDMVRLRKKYGTRLAFKGGIDKFALRGTEQEIDRELNYRLDPILLGGGTVFGLDHRIPNGVTIGSYRHYVREGRRILGLPQSVPSPHVRMAF